MPDALKAADDAWLFKMLVRGLARNHEMAASFMAKPYADLQATGCTRIFRCIDQNGKNIMANDTDDGTPQLHNAIAGCLAGIPELALDLRAPWQQLRTAGAGRPTPPAFAGAYDNRTASRPGARAAIRPRSGSTPCRGGAVYPYLFLAAVLGSALDRDRRRS